MGQGEVINFLKKQNKPLTSTEIAECLDIGMRSVRRILGTLSKDPSCKLVFKKLTPKERLKRYGKVVNTNRIRVYFLKK